MFKNIPYLLLKKKSPYFLILVAETALENLENITHLEYKILHSRM